jgi:cytochrome c553
MRVRAVDVARFGALMSAMWVVVAVHGADSSAGRAKTEVCTTCHGTDGHSPNPLIPSMAGQPPLYIYYQLLQFREQRRVNEQMSPFAVKLTDTDMKDIAAYFSSQRALGTGQSSDEARSAAGQAVVARHHCDSCHTPTFAGQNHIPRIAGLHYEYLVKQLRGFKSGERPDIDGSMTTAAQPLSDQDMADVSWYLAGLR